MRLIPVCVSFISKSNSENRIKIYWFLTKLRIQKQAGSFRWLTVYKVSRASKAGECQLNLYTETKNKNTKVKEIK